MFTHQFVPLAVPSPGKNIKADPCGEQFFTPKSQFGALRFKTRLFWELDSPAPKPTVRIPFVENLQNLLHCSPHRAPADRSLPCSLKCWGLPHKRPLTL